MFQGNTFSHSAFTVGQKVEGVGGSFNISHGGHQCRINKALHLVTKVITYLAIFIFMRELDEWDFKASYFDQIRLTE